MGSKLVIKIQIFEAISEILVCDDRIGRQAWLNVLQNSIPSRLLSSLVKEGKGNEHDL